MLQKINEIILKSERYKNFTLLNEEVKFKDLFKDRNISLVQLHDCNICLDEIIGFCGVFSWGNNKIKSLDGDLYYDEMLVIGYNFFNNDEYDTPCLDILVTQW